MRTLSRPILKVMASVCALFVMIEPVAIRAQTIGDQDRASDKTQSVEVARSESVPNVEADALKIRDWRVSQANELLWTSSGQSRPGRWSRPLKTTGAKRASAKRGVQRALSGVALGLAGWLAGGLTGAALEGNCRCDDPGLKGFIVGSSVGAVVGATIGVAIIR